MRFEEFIGNEKVKQQLEILLEAGRFPHAVILEGDEGMGKKTLAKEIALSLICQSEDEKPCRKCAQCGKVLKNIHPDIFEYSAPGSERSFKIETVREIIKDAYVKPNEALYKIYILSNCQCMGAPAQNALLKMIEEPPEYAVFILCTTNKASFLETVLSRSVVISLEGVESSAGANYICKKDESIDFDEALSCVSICGGNIGKALETLGDGKLKKIVEISNGLALALLENNEYELLKACSVFERDNQTMIASLSFLKSILRDALLYESGAPSVSNQSQTVKTLARRLTAKKLLKLIEVCDGITAFAKGNGNNALLITKLCYDFRRAINR